MKLKLILLVASQLPVAAWAQQNVDTFDQIVVGEDATRSIETNLNGFPVPTSGVPIYVGVDQHSADGIMIDSGANFPPGIAFRRHLGDAADPQPVMVGSQLGYLDFRGLSGGQFHNAGSLDMIVDPRVNFQPGSLMPTAMRFAVSDGSRVGVAMELVSNGRLEVGASTPTEYLGPGFLGDPKLFVNQTENKWTAILAARPSSGPSFGLRIQTNGNSSQDYILAGTSGASGSTVFSVRGNGDTYVAGSLFVGNRDIAASLAPLAFGDAGTAAAQSAGAAAMGSNARANGQSATALGHNTLASNLATTALGANAAATAMNAIAVGSNANAVRTASVALGHGSLAQGVGGVAVGAGAAVIHDGSTAIGATAVSSAANQVTLGGSGSSVRIGDLAASTAAQVGAVDAVTVDANGTLGRQQVATVQDVARVRADVSAISAITDAQFNALSSSVVGLQGQVGTLFDLATTQRKETRQGLAAVTALAHPPFPSAAGKTSYASNIGYYRGEVGLSAGVTHRLEGNFAITGGVSYAGGKNTALRAGVAGEF